METTLTRKGQVTIPRHIRESLSLKPGSKLVFDLNKEGEIVLRIQGSSGPHKPDRFERAIGAAQIKLGCSTDEYMEWLRGYSDDPA
jgi:AbrB family looped-hinge helix DNA binding protein